MAIDVNGGVPPIYAIVDQGMCTDLEWTPFHVLAKVQEESGELAESIIIQQKQSSYKELKHEDQVFEEVADVIITAVDAVTKTYRNTMSATEIASLIEHWIGVKRGKWERVSLGNQK